ncbi:phosphodiester glycosidase family protein [Microcoleus sp. FACHB-1515]|nr:phosphodiester glycosidase family protein [Microcoleus sp. FACHB-1515]
MGVRSANSSKLLVALPLLALVYAFAPKGGTAEALRMQAAPSIAQSWLPEVAQAQPVPIVQGSQINLNGRSIPAFWSSRQQRIGLSDAALLQAIGVDLLNSQQPIAQPVQWFSQPSTEPLNLTTWLTSQYRYLDITDFAQRYGWQIQASGATLAIRTPAARVTTVRQGRQTWGDRIVLDLDRPAPFQVSEQGSEIVVAIDGAIDPAIAQSFVPTPGNRLTSLRVESSGAQTLVRIGVPNNLRPRVWTLPNPNRLVIDIRPDNVIDRDIAWAPGIRWRQQTVRTARGQFPTIALIIDPRQPGVSLQPIWSNPASAVGTAPLISMAQRWQAIGAINAGYFNRNNQLPLGALRQNNRWVSGPILGRGAIGWGNGGAVAIDRFALQEAIQTVAGTQIPILTLNSGYVQAGVARFTADWGATYSPIIDNEVLITVQADPQNSGAFRVVRQQQGGAAGSTSVPLPRDGFLLVVRSNSAVVNALPQGTTLTLASATQPPEFAQMPQIVAAGPLLVRNRQIVLNAQGEQFTSAFIGQSAVRSAIATTAEGNLMLVTVQNRIGGLGPTLAEHAQVMQQLGIINALNLDGGSSTSLYLGGQLLNRAPRTAARVHNGIGVFIQPTQ